MRSSWRIFIVIEALMALYVLYQLINNTQALVFLIFGVFNVIYALKRNPRTSFNQFQLILGLVISLLSLLTSGLVVWIMLVFAILYLGLMGIESTGMGLFDHFNFAPWREKQIHMIETVDPEPKNGKRYKRAWFGNERIGSNTYEWDDINFAVVSGDTIIDLGNTLLPKDDNVVMIRKGFGRTRIIVPLGIGVLLEHSSVSGNVIFEEETFKLKNESIKLFSENYDNNVRRLKIVTNTILGDIEVIRV